MSRFRLFLAAVLALAGVCQGFRMDAPGIGATQRIQKQRSRNLELKASAVPIPPPIIMKPGAEEAAKNANKLLGGGKVLLEPFKKIKMGWKAFAVVFMAFAARFQKDIKNKAQTVTDSMEGGWKARGYGTGFQRTVEIWIFAISWGIQFSKAEKLKKKGTPDSQEYIEAKKKCAVVLRDKLLELGPTFIKLGQLLSTRIDVLPKEYITELVLLQDQVPGFSGDLAVQIIEEEFKAPITELYDTFDRTPIAAASLGQVHRATKNGQELAVKVQRQGLKELFDMDLNNIKLLAVLLDKFDPKSDGAQRDWVSIYDESAKLLYKEINYEAEALNSIRFQENFAEEAWIKVPDVYLNMTSPRVVTMEFVPGIKVGANRHAHTG
jgi:hypothetical protein